ncbi:MAG TPA: 5-(carboxyamino)imidazole ribonucleotide synthase [Alphaproteobacteria bacterium]|nr:5-(carboxyamino)imidazole ribonucleotide synthase [Alphaproteobacteria bacterium]
MKTLPPGSTIGILGGGQLARMTALAAARLGYKTHIYTAGADEPACQVTPLRTIGAFDDRPKLEAFAKSIDVCTLEWENVPVEAVEAVEKHTPCHPKSSVLHITQNRLLEKGFARDQGVATPDFRPAHSAAELRIALNLLGLPCVVKTARFGYDGKGQVVIRELSQADEAWKSLKTTEAIVEKLVPLEKEMAVIVARRADGTLRAYPPVETRHKNGILDEAHVPAVLDEEAAKQAVSIAEKLCEKLEVVGLLAVEMFLVQNRVLLNEMAPRPHNSGHWSIDGATTSQFEQLVRAICGLPLGDAQALFPCVMKNLLGDEVNDWRDYLNMPGAHVHLYGKKEAREGRKMGHVTIRNRRSEF